MIRYSFIYMLVTLALFAAPKVWAANNEVEITKTDVEVFIEMLSNSVIDTIDNKELTDDEKEIYLITLFDKHVDTKWMATFTLGRHNRKMSLGLKDEYVQLYHIYLVRSYIPRFRDYGSRSFSILRVQKKSANDYIVNMKLSAKKSSPSVLVNYRVRKTEEGALKLVDVVGEGISLIQTQRSDFGGLISRKGVKFFVEKLRNKVKKLIAKKVISVSVEKT